MPNGACLPIREEREIPEEVLEQMKKDAAAGYGPTYLRKVRKRAVKSDWTADEIQYYITEIRNLFMELWDPETMDPTDEATLDDLRFRIFIAIEGAERFAAGNEYWKVFLGLTHPSLTQEQLKYYLLMNAMKRRIDAGDLTTDEAREIIRRKGVPNFSNLPYDPDCFETASGAVIPIKNRKNKNAEMEAYWMKNRGRSVV